MSVIYEEAFERADTSTVCVSYDFGTGLSVTPVVEKLMSTAYQTEIDGRWDVVCAKCGQCALLQSGVEQILGPDCTTA
ncbi:MAG: hypothetical protein ABIR37_04020 [Candidatus Saccharimonadales bacterium]